MVPAVASGLKKIDRIADHFRVKISCQTMAVQASGDKFFSLRKPGEQMRARTCRAERHAGKCQKPAHWKNAASLLGVPK
jgi:hypothetical protein